MKLDKAKITFLSQKEIHELPVLLYHHAVLVSKTIDFYPLFKSTIMENLLKLKTKTNYF